MWLKYLFLAIVFYFLALFQASFLPQLNILGAAPNFIFILFFLLVFFSEKKDFLATLQNIFLAVAAGFFLSLYSKSFFGAEILGFVLIAIFITKLQESLVEKGDKYPFVYFAPIFLACFLFFEIFLGIGFYFYNHIVPSNLNWFFFAEILYNFLFGWIGFYVFKKIQNKKF